MYLNETYKQMLFFNLKAENQNQIKVILLDTEKERRNRHF